MTPLLDKMKAGRRRWLAAAAGVGVVLALSACAVVDSGRAPATSASDAWVVLPIVNYTETPQAGLRAETIATSILKARGFTNLKQYPANLNSESLFEPAEREAVALIETGAPINAEAVKYLNRLSDHLFVAARRANANGAGDVKWKPGATR